MRQLFVAEVGTVLLFAFGAGMLAIHLVLAIVFRIAQLPLLALATFANRSLLKRLITAHGILLKTLVVIIKFSR